MDKDPHSSNSSSGGDVNVNAHNMAENKVFPQSLHLIQKLEGNNNYANWKFQMKMFLIDVGLWHCISTDKYTSDEDVRALAKICLNVHTNVYPYVKNATTAKEAWRNILNAFENQGISRRLALKRDLYKSTLTNHSSMESYIAHIIDIVQQLRDIGCTVEDEELAEVLLIGLPEEYDPLILAIEGSQCKLSSDIIINRLKQGDFRKQEQQNIGVAMISKSKRKIICHYCHKEGHIRPKCPILRPKVDNNKHGHHCDNTVQPTVAMSTCLMEGVCEPNEWLLDSGCSTHMTMRKDWLVNFSNCSNKTVKVANNHNLYSNGIGNVKVFLNNNVEKTVCDVSYVPGIAANLLSVNKITQKGYVLIFDNKGCKAFAKEDVIVNANPIFPASNVNGLYKLNQQQFSPEYACSGNNYENQSIPNGENRLTANCIELWRKRLGHLSYQGLVLLRDGLAKGVNFKEASLLPCIPCIEGKQRIVSFPSGRSRYTSQKLELIHSDLCGPMPVPSWGNKKYILTLTDDFSRKTFVYFLYSKNQTEILEKFLQFKNLVENQTGLKI